MGTEGFLSIFSLTMCAQHASRLGNIFDKTIKTKEIKVRILKIKYQVTSQRESAAE